MNYSTWREKPLLESYILISNCPKFYTKLWNSERILLNYVHNGYYFSNKMRTGRVLKVAVSTFLSLVEDRSIGLGSEDNVLNSVSIGEKPRSNA